MTEEELQPTTSLSNEEVEEILDEIDWENYDFKTEEDLYNLEEHANFEVYSKDFIIELCTSEEFEFLTLEEHNTCFIYNQTVQDFSYSHILIGAFMGFIAVKGLFDSWK